jgi:glycosyltransferase involved in cell wall biosynthesis
LDLHSKNKKLKKILVIYPGFPHYRDGILKKMMESRNLKYVFIADKNGYNNLKPFDFKDYPDFHHRPSRLINRFLFHKGLVRFVLNQKASGAIVHASPYWPSIILASIILKLKGVPVYNWTHGVLGNKINLKNKFYNLFFKLGFNGLLLYGNNSKKNLIQLGHKAERLKVIYNSLDYQEQIILRGTLNEKKRLDIRSKYFPLPELFQLVFIGRLTGLKKLNMLIEAMHLLKNEGISTNLLFVGDGDEKEKLKKQIKEYSLENNVHFYGACYDEVTNYQLLDSSDCCIAPGEIGLTAMHSLMYGIPVISHNDGNRQMPEYEAIIPGKNGALFEYGNVEDLKEKIKDVMTMTRQNPDLKKECYKIMDQYYNPDYQIKLIESLF